MDLWIHTLGWLAGAVGMVSAAPQLVRIFRERTSAGVSISMWQLNVVAMTAWSCHGFLVGRLNLQLPNLTLALSSMAVLVMICRDRQESVLPRLGIPILLGGLLFIGDLLWGPVIFGLLAAIPLTVGQIAQYRDLRSSPDITGVSAGFLGVNVLVQSLWLVWAPLAKEWAVAACATVLTILTLLNLGYYVHRRHESSRTRLSC